MSENSNVQQVDPFQRLQAELNDAHLVIGKQQVSMLRMQQVIQMQQVRIEELERKYESDPAEVG